MSRKDPEARIRTPWAVEMYCPACGAIFEAEALGEWTCPTCGAMSWGRLSRRAWWKRALAWGLPAAAALALALAAWGVLVRACGGTP